MNIAPDSSLRVEMRPDSNEVKNVSGTHVNVCLDVLNLKEKRELITNILQSSKMLNFIDCIFQQAEYTSNIKP